MLKIVEQLSSVLSPDDSETPTPSTEHSTPKNGSLLHQCPECMRVFLSEQPQECSQCATVTVSLES